jgi:hypothetical protein
MTLDPYIDSFPTYGRPPFEHEGVLQKLVQVQDRIRHAFGVRQLQNVLRAIHSGQPPRHPSVHAAVYSMDHSVAAHQKAALEAPQLLPRAPPASVVLTGTSIAVEGGQTCRRSALEGHKRWSRGCVARGVGCLESEDTVDAEGHGRVEMECESRGAAAQSPGSHRCARACRPQTARPFQIRTRMEAELEAELRRKVCGHCEAEEMLSNGR